MTRNVTIDRITCFFRAVLMFGLVGFFTLTPPKAAFPLGEFIIDPDHSSIIFRVKHLGITFVYGRFNHATGHYAFQNSEFGTAEIDIRVKAMDIDTGNVVRDDDLRSPDFFHAEKYPWVTFKSVSIEPLVPESFKVTGDLSFHGVTNRIVIEAFKTGSREDLQGRFRTGFQATFSIRRSDYGMKYMLWGVGDQVELTVSVEGVQNL